MQRFRVWVMVARRLLASILLVSVTAAFAVPVSLHEHASSRDCHHPASAGTPVFLTASSLGGCDQMSGSVCAMMAGCASLTPAVASSPVRGVPASLVATIVLATSSTIHGRLVLGPPTPPPNS